MSFLFDEMSRFVAPLKRRVFNLIIRAIIDSVEDTTKMQIARITLGKGEIIEGIEHPQPYGFTARAKKGAEAVVLFPGGNRNQGILIMVEDSRYRLIGLPDGGVAMYDFAGNYIKMTENAGIEIATKTGKDISISCKNCSINLESGGKFSVAGTNLTVDK
jgi:phage baseplate assembly protein V